MRIDEEQLERMIDGSSLADVVLALSNVAIEKAEHITVNWQDKRTAQVWTTAGNALDRVFRQILELGI